MLPLCFVLFWSLLISILQEAKAYYIGKEKLGDTRQQTKASKPTGMKKTSSISKAIEEGKNGSINSPGDYWNNDYCNILITDFLLQKTVIHVLQAKLQNIVI